MLYEQPFSLLLLLREKIGITDHQISMIVINDTNVVVICPIFFFFFTSHIFGLSFINVVTYEKFTVPTYSFVNIEV